MSIFFLGAPSTTQAVGDLHVYSMPGVWAQDLPTSWFTNLHLRYFDFDKIFDSDGNKTDVTGMDGFQIIGKVGHVYRVNDQWQLTNVLTIPRTHLTARSIPGIGDMSASGFSDWISTNTLGWHNRANSLHLSTGFSLTFPLGDYSSDDPINMGKNRWILYFPYAFIHGRLPVFDGLLMIDNSVGIEWRFENSDIGWDDHDVLEANLILTYFLSRQAKFGVFVQPDLQMALNESTLKGIGQNDSDFYTFGGALGILYTPKSTCMLHLKYTQELFGREINDGAPAPVIKAWHFIMTYLF